MYLTVLKMTKNSLSNRETFLNIFDGNAVHRFLTGQQHQDRATGKILYRIYSQKKEIFLYIQTDLPFNTDGIEKYGLFFVQSACIDTLIGRLQQNDFVRFNIRTVPAKRTKGTSRYLYDANEREEWLTDKLAKAGLQLIQGREVSCDKLSFSRQGKRVNVPEITYEGIARVTDLQLFCKAVEAGIGKERCFGAGLLLWKTA